MANYSDKANAIALQLSGGGSGSGETNYVTNGSGAVALDRTGTNDEGDWIDSNASNFTASVTTTSAELPREFLTTTAIKFKPVTTTAADYVRYRFQIGEADKNRKLKIQWAQLVGSTVVNDEFKVELWSGTDATYATTTEVPLSGDDTSGDSFIKATNGGYINTFSAGSDDYYELRIVKVGVLGVVSTDWISLNDVVIGPGSITANLDPRWPRYTDADFSITSNATSFSIHHAEAMPYQLTDGSWRMTFNFATTNDSTADQSITWTGVTFEATTNFIQSLSMLAGGAAQNTKAFANPNTSTITTDTDTANTAIRVSGDVALESKPTWATKSAPDTYLGKVPSVVTGWTSSTDFTASTGYGASAEEYYYKRSGDEMHVKCRITVGTTTTEKAYVTLPTGYTLDFTKLSAGLQSTHVGEWTSLSTGASVEPYPSGTRAGRAFVDDAAPSRIYLARYVDQNRFETGAVSSIFGPASGSILVLNFSVPIAEWAGGSQDTATVGFGEATEDQLGLNKKNKWAKNDWSTSASDLNFNNLTIGKTYRATVYAILQLSADSTAEYAQIKMNHDSSEITKIQLQLDQVNSSNDSKNITAQADVIFEASATTVTFVSGTGGSGGISGAYSMIEELNNYESETTDFT